MRFLSCNNRLLKTAKEKETSCCKTRIAAGGFAIARKVRAGGAACVQPEPPAAAVYSDSSLTRRSTPLFGASFHFLFHLVHVWNLVIASGVTCDSVTFAKACFHHPSSTGGYLAYSAHKETPYCKTRIAAGGFAIARKARAGGAACVQPEPPAAAVYPDGPFTRLDNSLKICSFITLG